ncbi:hypothetical protein V502_00093 [Pseudogymnoascus sp. VKM F-4520 (FW-2644)]|nr:hypothetical protein V502_00093 [Pseudogymnoascus sp. VKM F-4520 (FW-2644)]
MLVPGVGGDLRASSREVKAALWPTAYEEAYDVKRAVLARPEASTGHILDIVAATAFYTAIGATKNETFSNETGSCMVFSDTIYVMILLPSFFAQFVPPEKQTADSKKVSEVLLCITVDKKEEVDEIVAIAAKDGGKADPTKLPEMEGMYGRSFADTDGHVWELMWSANQE